MRDPLIRFSLTVLLQKILVSAQICILDLGQAVDVSVYSLPRQGRVYTQAYRAPEVTLGLLLG